MQIINDGIHVRCLHCGAGCFIDDTCIHCGRPFKPLEYDPEPWPWWFLLATAGFLAGMRAAVLCIVAMGG